MVGLEWGLNGALAWGFVFVFGAIVGSFLNVCIYRLPKGLSIVEPPSHCFHCQAAIRPLDNIPLLSYVLLRGRCRECGTPFSPRYFLVELLTALLAVALLWRFGLTPALFLYFAFAAALVVVTFIDLDYLIIPDAISLPGIGVGLTASFLIEGTPAPLESAIGVVLGAGILWAVAFAYEKLTGTEGMGFGDVKLLAMIGAFLGWRGVPLCLLIGSLSGSVIGITAMAILGKDRKWEIPFGPFLALGAILTLLFGSQLVSWYLQRLA
jgi:leader peptidase (prepilin peptidase)/N-methyltransferase